MRRSLLIFPVWILLIIIIAFMFVHFGFMTMTEFIGKVKVLSLLLAPVAFFVGLFVFDGIRKRKRDKKG